MIAVQTSTLTRFSMKSRITFSSWCSFIWPCAIADLRLGNQRAQMTRHVVDILDAVVHEEHLAAAVQLAQDRVADRPSSKCATKVRISLPVRRRRLDNREIADPEHRHVQRARNRRRRHRQHRTSFLSFLIRSLSATPKRCSSSIMSRPSRGNCTSFGSSRCVPMTISTLPRRDLLDDLFIFLVAAKSRDHFDAHRVILEARAKCVPMLLGENRRRHQYRDLAAVHHRDERGAQRDFGLAEAGVAADQAIHRLDRA